MKGELIKIADFGLAHGVPVPEDTEREGDRAYLAPELLTSNPVGTAADIFSLGLIVLEMAADVELPQNGPIWHQLRTDDFETVMRDWRLSNQLKTVVLSMLRSKPELRPSAIELLAEIGISREVVPGLLQSTGSSINLEN